MKNVKINSVDTGFLHQKSPISGIFPLDSSGFLVDPNPNTRQSATSFIKMKNISLKNTNSIDQSMSDVLKGLPSSIKLPPRKTAQSIQSHSINHSINIPPSIALPSRSPNLSLPALRKPNIPSTGLTAKQSEFQTRDMVSNVIPFGSHGDDSNNLSKLSQSPRSSLNGTNMIGLPKLPTLPRSSLNATNIVEPPKSFVNNLPRLPTSSISVSNDSTNILLHTLPRLPISPRSPRSPRTSFNDINNGGSTISMPKSPKSPTLPRSPFNDTNKIGSPVTPTSNNISLLQSRSPTFQRSPGRLNKQTANLQHAFIPSNGNIVVGDVPEMLKRSPQRNPLYGTDNGNPIIPTKSPKLIPLPKLVPAIQQAYVSPIPSKMDVEEEYVKSIPSIIDVGGTMINQYGTMMDVGNRMIDEQNVGPPGIRKVSIDDISNIPLSLASEKNIIKEECCVCYDKAVSPNRLTTCRHAICKDCTYQLRKKECPTCRVELSGGYYGEQVDDTIKQFAALDKRIEELTDKTFRHYIQLYETRINPDSLITDAHEYSQAFATFVYDHPDIRDDQIIDIFDAFVQFMKNERHINPNITLNQGIYEFSVIGTVMMDNDDISFDELYDQYFRRHNTDFT